MCVTVSSLRLRFQYFISHLGRLRKRIDTSWLSIVRRAPGTSQWVHLTHRRRLRLEVGQAYVGYAWVIAHTSHPCSSCSRMSDKKYHRSRICQLLPLLLLNTSLVLNTIIPPGTILILLTSYDCCCGSDEQRYQRTCYELSISNRCSSRALRCIARRALQLFYIKVVLETFTTVCN